MDYPIVIRPLSDEEGGGYLATFPDLAGCVSDGETAEEALANAKEAFAEWMETNKRHARQVPAPGSAFKAAAKQKRAAIKAIKDLAESFQDVDGRMEKVEGDLADLREQVEHAAAWLRFSEITGAGSDDTRDDAPSVNVC
ncbi:type II toxin-antitoxin system HicB family antitoxin [Jiella avicenniae]|uniref:Type II toxin-antitoxin system HicB family antitoxin n=1 Tax=Jiella avicenniae TaxID=2907202 RepID=A0A9X1T4X9_9HYPH|nr:type II toxin-antitoxin system HicB family antitoxin [Jiella avicenniae]MCE7028497.1 type II toxin-antitoxin system HicB family antitoxin [Jiella avicenniae]